jgi:hypothetical protein
MRLTTTFMIPWLFLALPLIGQPATDVSLCFKRGNSEQITHVESKSGNLFRKLEHHGPAVENPWYGLRLYFDKKAAIDVYSKARPGLELKDTRWYPSKQEQLLGFGADYYRVGGTVGLGGIRLWDGDQVVSLQPVTLRSASVECRGDSSWMEMVSEGVPYRDGRVDVGVRVTVYDCSRIARVDATSLNGTPLQFVSGINYFDDLEVIQTENYIATWGIHPEDVAAEKYAVGGSILVPPQGIEQQIDTGEQHLMITEPAKHVTFYILSACERENGMEQAADFIALIENLTPNK